MAERLTYCRSQIQTHLLIEGLSLGEDYRFYLIEI